jgi:NADH-quinone oxidoreductase subunit K
MSDIYFHLTVSHFLILAAVLFTIGVVGVLMRRNALIVMMSIELMLNAANLTVVSFARMHGDMHGHALAFVVIAVAAAEAAVGLAIVVAVFRSRRHADIDRLTSLKY